MKASVHAMNIGSTKADAALPSRILDIIETAILPVTERGVAAGNKIFGAAILRKSDLSLVLAETNNETENPLWHGEMHALKRFYEIPAGRRPASRDCLFISTHEPCSLCLSAITWGGFDNFWFLFSHADSRDAFAIPHDLAILKAVFRLEPGGYAKKNVFWTAHDLREEIGALAPDLAAPLQQRLTAIIERYGALSAQYQAGKASNDIPLN